ncbi:FHA domain-containing protein [Pseudomonas quasicaspiana]|nr:FHA domain-containing protein [Pseudomonas quasicaspiana]
MYELRVLNGLHRGAALPLIGDHWLVGSDEQHDLLLQDPGIARRHCILTCDGETWRLEAEDGSLFDEQGQPCDSLNALTAEQTFRLGTVQLSIMASTAQWPAVVEPKPSSESAPSGFGESRAESQAPPSPSQPAKRPALHKRLAIAGIVVTLAGSAWALTTPGPVSPSPTTTQPREPSALSATDTAEKLQVMLRERELRDTVSVSTSAEGIVLKGSLTPEQMALYKRMLERFGQQQKSSVAVLDQVKPFGRKLPFEIVQIASGKRAHVVLADNRRLFLGDEVDGLRLTKIDDNHVEFDGDEHYEVKW